MMGRFFGASAGAAQPGQARKPCTLLQSLADAERGIVAKDKATKAAASPDIAKKLQELRAKMKKAADDTQFMLAQELEKEIAELEAKVAANKDVIRKPAIQEVEKIEPAIQDVVRKAIQEMPTLAVGEVLMAMNMQLASKEVCMLTWSEVHEKGLERIRTHLQGSSAADEFVSLNGLETVLQAMAAFRENATIQHQGCWVFRKMAENKIYQPKISSLGAIQHIISAMENHTASHQVQEEACGALSLLALDSQVWAGYIVRMGGIEAIVAAKKAHLSSPDMQKKCCTALLSFVPNEVSRATPTLRNQEKIAAVGGIEAVIRSMEKHVALAQVQIHAMSLLCNLAHANRENQFIIARHGGIEAIIKAMATHECGDAVMASTDVQEHGCYALRSLANANPKTQAQVALLGGIDAVVRVMELEGPFLDVLEQACLTLRDLAAGNPKNQEIIEFSGGKAQLEHLHEKYLRRLLDHNQSEGSNLLKITRETLELF